MPNNDRTISENSQENLDRKLDHAIKETFPTSDPVSVTITKGGAIDYDEQGVATSGPDGVPLEGRPATAGNLLDEAKDTLNELASSATAAASEAYGQGRRFVQDAADQYPEAERYYRKGAQAVRQQAAENPLLMLFGGVFLGYVLAWMIHSGSAEDRRVPDSARTRQRIAPDER